MNATTCLHTLRAMACAGVLFAGLTAPAATFTIVDGEGFEAPRYSTTFAGTGRLNGQTALTEDGAGLTAWQQDQPFPSPSTAVVQGSIVSSGSQAVRVDRASGSDVRWGVRETGLPVERLVCIDWDMRVEQTVAPSGAFGPFFGIEAYGDASGIVRLGMLGVDATTGELLYGDAIDGLVPTPGGQTVAFGEWFSYRMVLDYLTETYYGFVDGVLVLTTPFEFPSNGEFTDAPITAIAAQGDAVSLALSGTAYFDNYVVVETDDINKIIPEPAALATGLVGLALLAVRRR